MDFITGGLAGAGATILTNPIDVVKTRMQLQGELRTRSEQTIRYRGILHAIFVIAKTDGALALQKGLTPAMLFGFSMNSVRLGTYHVAEVQGWTKTKEGELSVTKAMFWAAAGGVFSGITGNPLSVLKTRIQAAAHPSIAVGNQHIYKGTLDGIKQIYKHEGIKGFYAGASATCTRLGIGSAAQLTTYSTVKSWLIENGHGNLSPTALAFIASLVSGLACLIVETPLDVTNTRLCNQGPAKALYKGVFDCLAKTYKIEGIHGMYKGFWPMYLRIAPHTTLSLVIWDLLNRTLLHDKKS